MPDISYVTGTFQRLPLLQKCLASVRASIPKGFTYEIIVVDGGSTDGSLEWLHQQPDVKLIEHGALLGIKKSFCDGCKIAQGKYVIMGNDDVEFQDTTSIVKAFVYLENNPTCGGVAFADNRVTPHNPHGQHRVNVMMARKNGADVNVVYAQIGMFPKWLGDLAGWWGEDDPTFKAKAYGLDNYLSARIWEMGYTVDAVDGVIVHDFAPDDELRQHNEGWPEQGGGDGHLYYERYPKGPDIPPDVTIPSQTRRQLRILYAPIYERGHVNQHLQKHGLRDALMSAHGRYKGALVYEWDYVASDTVDHDLFEIIKTFQPDMILWQLHGANTITRKMLDRVRSICGNVLMVNWNGDYNPAGLISAPMLDLLQQIDLQLVVNATAIPVYDQHGIRSAYWQIGYEEPGNDLPDVPAYGILFMGNAYKPERQELGRWLKANYASVGLYGSGWNELGDGECLYDFATGKALINKAKVVIGDNMYPETYGFVSNRLIQSLAAGGALLLHQPVLGLEELTGLVDTKHYATWQTTNDLKSLIDFMIQDDEPRRTIANAGTEYVRQHYSFNTLVEQLFVDLLPLANRKLQHLIGLRYQGRHVSQFGAGVGVTSGRQYICTPPHMLWIDPLDLPGFQQYGDLWKQVDEIAPHDRLGQGV
jgi:glycosyltransferase involved in cell wall biosynthesis